MKTQLEKRLKELQTEFEAGQKMLTDLEAKQANLRDTLLRLSGAIQVLQEELGQGEENGKAENGKAASKAKVVEAETVV